jgi:MFS family permease
MGALIAAGEAIFFLPFVVARVFRPTLLDVLGITNLELGTAFSIYGVVATGAYLAGGFLADRYPARRLMVVALVSTAAGGAVMAGLPSRGELRLLFAYWGLTTIFLFWAALIRATRLWGGADRQGRAYGLLEGGRGVFAALMASLGVAVFAAVLVANPETATLADRAVALQRTIWILTAMTLASAVLVWLSLPAEEPGEPDRRPAREPFDARALRMPSVWLQAVIVLCAYVGYKAGDDFGLYARDAFGYDDVASARLSTLSFWVRPGTALGAGLLADRVRPSQVLAIGFGILVLGSLGLASGWLAPDPAWLIVMTVAATAVGLHGLRGVYFAVLGEARVPWHLTGSAVGVISLVGYTPDIFMGPLMGFLIDRSPGAAGHQHLFTVVAGFALLGLVAAKAVPRVTAASSPPQDPPPALLQPGARRLKGGRAAA